jgi:5'-nucleotidase / UDP-sugar diphosphatase
VEAGMRRIWRLLLCLFLAFIVAAPPGDAREPSPVPLTLLHVNDLHGRLLPYPDKSISETTPVGGAARLARMIADERAKNPDGSLLLAAGDMFQGAPVSNVFRGQSVIEVMNYLRFDAMALGNHEFDWGPNLLHELAASADFPFLAANIQDQQGQSVPLTRPYVILKRKDLNIAVIGLTTPDTAFITKPDYVSGLTFREPTEILPPLLKEVRSSGADLIVLLSHSGLEADRVVAEQVSGIDVIVGGHSHTSMTHPLRVNDTVIVQAGSYGAYLGVLQLEVDPTTHKILAYTRDNELKPVMTGPGETVDEKVAGIVGRFNDQIKSEFARVIGETSVDLIRSPHAESNLGNLITDALKESSGSDIAFHNGGGIRADIPKGKITLEQVYTLLPFDNFVVVMNLTGDQVRQILEQNTTFDHQLLQVSGLAVDYDVAAPAGSRAIRVFVGNQPLEPDRIYRVATNDFLAVGGDQYTTFQEGKNIVYGDSLRDVFAAYLEKHSPVHPEIQKRMVFVTR